MDLTANRGPELFALQTAFLVIAWMAVALRVFVRTCITKSFKTDDWLMLLALAVFTLSAGFMFTSIRYGLGMHNNALSLYNLTEALKYQAIVVYTYIMNMLIIKLSIAFFLLHIAVQKGYVYAIKICTVIVAIVSIFAFFFTVFRCWPMELQWSDAVAGYCLPGKSFVAVAYSYSVISIVSDWLYALLPIPMIWSIKMNIGTKISVLMILSLGVVASIATIVRCAYLAVIINSNDLLFGTVDAEMWTIIEPGLGITAASLVTLRPLLRALKVPGFSTPSTEPYETSGRVAGHRMGSYTPMSGSRVLEDKSALNGTKSTTVIRTESIILTPNTSQEHILPIQIPGDAKSTVRTTVTCA